MKKSLLFLLGLVAFISTLNAQWVAQTNPTTAQLNSVCFVNANTGWAVGNLGNIIHTVNGGTTWTAQNSTVSENLYSVSFYDINNGWAVGNNGTVLQTADGGMNWVSMMLGSEPYPSPLYSVQFTSATNGWIVGGDTLASTGDYFKFDGSQWTQGTINLTPVQIYSLNSTDAWMLCTDGNQDYFIYKTVNGGQNFSQQNMVTTLISSLALTDANNGWTVGYDNFLHYNGSIWNPVTTSFNTMVFYSLALKNATNGWAVGANGAIIKYDGSQWTAQTSNTTNTLYSVYFTDVNNGWAVGKFGTIMHTTNGGKPGSGFGINEIKKSFFNVQAYPNPCADHSTLTYQLSENSQVNIRLFDLTGNEISTLVNERKVKGDYNINIDAANLKSGAYLCKIQAGDYSEITKLFVIK